MFSIAGLVAETWASSVATWAVGRTVVPATGRTVVPGAETWAFSVIMLVVGRMMVLGAETCASCVAALVAGTKVVLRTEMWASFVATLVAGRTMVSVAETVTGLGAETCTSCVAALAVLSPALVSCGTAISLFVLSAEMAVSDTAVFDPDPLVFSLFALEKQAHLC